MKRLRPRTTVLRGSIIKQNGVVVSWNGFPVTPKTSVPYRPLDPADKGAC